MIDHINPKGPKMEYPGEAPQETPTVARLRKGLQEKTAEIHSLRLLAGALYSGLLLDLEDGEVRDMSMEPTIDFLRDSPEVIRQKIIARAESKGKVDA